MSRSFIRNTAPTDLASFLVRALQPTVSTMIDVVRAEMLKDAPTYLVKADLETIPVMPKVEYFLYVQRYGPPLTGIFDQQALDQIRLELGLIKALPNFYPKADGIYQPLPENDS